MIKKIFGYLFSDIANKLYPFFILPYLSYNLSVEDFSIFSTLLVFVNVFSITTLSGIQSKIVIDIAKYGSIDNYLINYFLVHISFFIPIAMFLKLISYFNDINYWYLIVWVYIYSFTLLVCAYFQAKESPFLYGFSINIYSFIVYFSIITGIEFYHDIYYLLNVGFVAILAIMCVILFLSSKKSQYSVNIFHKKNYNIILFAVKQFPHTISNVIRYGFDRFYLSVFLSTSFLGIYNVAVQSAMMMSVIIVSVNRYWFKFRLSSGEEEIKKYERIFSISLIFIFLSFIGFTYLYISMFFSNEYHDSIYISWILLLGFLFQGLYFIKIPIAYKNNNLKIVNVSSIISLVSYVILVVLLGEQYGYYGVAIALVISWILLYLSSLILIKVNFKHG